MATTKKDIYPQFMKLTVTMSGANTLTFAEVGIGLALFDYAALLIHRIEYFFSASNMTKMTADVDTLAAAITGSDSIADIDIDRPQVYDEILLNNVALGAAVGSVPIVKTPFVHDYSTFPGGGQLVPATNLYVACTSTGLATAAGVTARVWWTLVELQVAEYFELVQRLRVLST